MKQNTETLKEYFETGDKPSQQNFADLIDSLGMPMIGEIKAVSFAFAPEGWTKCNGELFAPEDHPELFALIGTTYGGDGVASFAVPDLKGRVPMGYGSGTGLSTYTIGQNGGEETHTLIEDEMPSHTHTTQTSIGEIALNGSASATIHTSTLTSTDSSNNTFLADNGGGDGFASSSENISLNPGAVTVDTSGLSVDITGLAVTNNNSGLNQAHNIMQPYLAVNYIIATKGINPI